MALDGLFIHYLVNELRNELLDSRINKIIQTTPSDIILQIHSKTNKNLLISSSTLNPHMNFTEKDFNAPNNPYNFCMVLRKYIERGIITDLSQINNDRIIILSIKSNNELGDDEYYKLVIELTSKNANIVLTTDKLVIIESLNKHFNMNGQRIIIPKAQYEPLLSDKINPFTMDESSFNVNDLEGISKFHQQFINNYEDLKNLLSKEVKPSKYIINNKVFLSPFSFNNYDHESYESLSKLIDENTSLSSDQTNPTYTFLKKFINKKIQLLNNKIANLEGDIENAKKHQDDLIKGQLLQSYLYQIEKGMKSITLFNYLNNEDITIELDPLKSPSANMQKYFKSYKKSLNTLKYVKEQIDITNNLIEYFDELLTQIEISKQSDLEEIKQELINNGFIKANKTKKGKTNISKSIKKILIDDKIIIYIGKNNQQNAYIISQLGKPNDYWFHVKDAPSAHILIKTSNLNERLIRICAHLASLNSKYSKSSSVMVDYTMFKYLKKIPNTLGCRVTYTNQSTIYIDPDNNILNKLIKEKSQEF